MTEQFATSDAAKAVFLATILLLEESLKTRFAISKSTDIDLESAETTIGEITIILSTDFTEIQCIIIVSDDAASLSKKKDLLTNSPEKPGSIIEKQLREIEARDVPSISRQFSQDIALFTGKLSAIK